MIRHTKIAILLLLAVFATLALPSSSPAQIAVGVSIRIGPPVLPVYAQPVCPAPGYIWTPGYWAWGPDGYFWVPGTWVLAPTPGYLWTPGYWGWAGGVYVWHGGYWGPHVGFYGGINYGFGYGGVGFVGGEWRGGIFHYNTAVTNVNTTIIHNTYVNNTVINKTVVNNVSYNGGTGGVVARPNASEQAAMHEHHVEATSLQTQHEQTARNDRTMLASYNHGRPAVAATARPGEFHGAGAVGAHGANVNANHANVSSNVHADRPPNARTNTSYDANHSVDRPQTNMRPENTNGNRPSNNNSNNYHSNAAKPPQPEHQNNRPPEHEARPGGHEGGHGGR